MKRPWEPAPESVAYVLDQRFGSRIADFLALRLVKEPSWPRGRVTGALSYLEQQKLPSTVPALLRFITETENDEARGYVVETIKAIAGPQLRSRVLIERERLNIKYRRRFYMNQFKSVGQRSTISGKHGPGVAAAPPRGIVDRAGGG